MPRIIPVKPAKGVPSEPKDLFDAKFIAFGILSRLENALPSFTATDKIEITVVRALLQQADDALATCERVIALAEAEDALDDEAEAMWEQVLDDVRVAEGVR